MEEVMYDHNSVFIVAVLFAVLVTALECGFQIGRRLTSETTGETKTQINTIQGSLLGVLALLLGFTFSLALQRFDSRSQAVVDEANAIGTALLRADLLPQSVRSQAKDRLRDYVDLRLRAGTISLDMVQERNEVLALSAETLDETWQLVLVGAEADAGPVTTGLFVQGFNDMVDAYGARDAELNRHVPEIVLFLLFGTFVLTVTLVGYSAGVSGTRTSFATYVLMVLIVALVFIIIDLDRPRRGLIEVSQQSLAQLQVPADAE